MLRLALERKEVISFMSRARPFLLTMLFLLAVSAAYAASASGHAIIIEGKEIAKGEVVAAEGSSIGTTTFEVEGFTSECKKSTSVAEFEAEGKSKSTITSSECKSSTGCTIKEPIVSNAKTELVIFKEKLAVKVLPASVYFTTATLSGCRFAGEWKLAGSQINELPEAGVEKVEHETVITPAGSSLKVSGPGGTFSGFMSGRATSKLKSGKKWHAS